jgi:DNA-binding transcriptional MerR regulator
MNKETREEIISGFFVGDTVILKEETDFSKKQGFNIGDIGIISKKDNEESLKGWEVFDYKQHIEETLQKLDSNQIEEIFSQIVDMLGENEIAELLKNIEEKK